MPNYTFKLLPELAWAAGIALLTLVATSLLQLTDDTDWETWAISLGVGSARAVAGAILDVLRRQFSGGSQ